MADALVAQNKLDYKHDKEPIPHDNPLLVKYFYVAGGGQAVPAPVRGEGAGGGRHDQEGEGPAGGRPVQPGPGVGLRGGREERVRRAGHAPEGGGSPEAGTLEILLERSDRETDKQLEHQKFEPTVT